MPPSDLDQLYEQLRDRTVGDAEFRARRTAFLREGDRAESYLLSRLAHETVPDLQGDVLQILGKFRYQGGKRTSETATWARRLLESPVATVRCRALWVLGWVGSLEDLERLSKALRGDEDAENRGWAATAMMQLHLEDETHAAEWLVPLKRALSEEKTDLALEKILVSIQEITGKRLGLKASSHERPSPEKLQAALRKALKA